MRNKVTCAAQRLSQLDPIMIEAVVSPEAFSIGKQYAAEHRAQILEADEASLNASVIGTHGLYAQSLRLKGGQLYTKCSCPLTEQPFCRHCVAALLAYYHRMSRQDIVTPPKEGKSPAKPVIIEPVDQEAPVAPEPAAPAAASSSPSLDLRLRDVTEFLEWVQPAVTAMEQLEALPPAPDRCSAEVKRLIQAVLRLDEQRRMTDSHCEAQATELRALQAQVGRMTQDLETANRAAKDAQAASEEFRRELDQTRSAAVKLSALEREHRLVNQRLQTVMAEITQKSADLERLSAAAKDTANALSRLSHSSGA